MDLQQVVELVTQLVFAIEQRLPGILLQGFRHRFGAVTVPPPELMQNQGQEVEQLILVQLQHFLTLTALPQRRLQRQETGVFRRCRLWRHGWQSTAGSAFALHAVGRSPQGIQPAGQRRLGFDHLAPFISLQRQRIAKSAEPGFADGKAEVHVVGKKLRIFFGQIIEGFVVEFVVIEVGVIALDGLVQVRLGLDGRTQLRAHGFDIGQPLVIIRVVDVDVVVEITVIDIEFIVAVVDLFLVVVALLLVGHAPQRRHRLGAKIEGRHRDPRLHHAVVAFDQRPRARRLVLGLPLWLRADQRIPPALDGLRLRGHGQRTEKAVQLAEVEHAAIKGQHQFGQRFGLGRGEQLCERRQRFGLRGFVHRKILGKSGGSVSRRNHGTRDRWIRPRHHGTAPVCGRPAKSRRRRIPAGAADRYARRRHCC